MAILCSWKATPLLITVYCLHTVLFCCSGLPTINCTTLRYVQMILHHGVSSPEVMFKNDPNNALWRTTSPGQLLKSGKQESFQLGQWFQKRYGEGSDKLFDEGRVHIRSTDTDRTRDTAQSFAAGLLSPPGTTADSTSLENAHHYLPVHVVPKNDDPFTDVYILDNCKRMQQYMDILQMTPEERRVIDENKELGKTVFRESGKSLENPREFLSVCDTLNAEKALGLQLPQWIQEDIDQVFGLRDYFSFQYIKMPEITQLSGGYLIRDIMNRMLDVMSSNASTHLKSYVHAAHDYTIMYIMSTMRLFNYLLPPYSSALILELHENRDGNYFVQVLYKNETQREPYVLNFPFCPDLCPWQQALLATGCYFVENLHGACTPMKQDEILQKQQEFNQLFP